MLLYSSLIMTVLSIAERRLMTGTEMSFTAELTVRWAGFRGPLRTTALPPYQRSADPTKSVVH